MAELFNNVLLKGATGQPIYPQTLMDNVYVQTAANGTVEGQQTLRQWLAQNYVGLSIQTATSLDSITDPKQNIIYFIPDAKAEAGGYIEYIYTGNDDQGNPLYEAIGSTDLDLSDYVTQTELENALKNYYTKAEVDAKFIDTEQIKNYYTKDEADNKFIDTEQIANYQPKGDYQPAGDYYTEQEIGYSDTTKDATGSTPYTAENSVSKRIAEVEAQVDVLNTFMEGADTDYVLVTDLSSATAGADAANKKYATSISNQVGATWLSTTATKTQLDTLTTGGKDYTMPVEQKVMDVISTMSVDGATSENNWLFKAIAGLGFVTDSPADDPSTAPYIVASVDGFNYWWADSLAALAGGAQDPYAVKTKFGEFLNQDIAVADSVLTSFSMALATCDQTIQSDCEDIARNLSSFGLVYAVTYTNDMGGIGYQVSESTYALFEAVYDGTDTRLREAAVRAFYGALSDRTHDLNQQQGNERYMAREAGRLIGEDCLPSVTQTQAKAAVKNIIEDGNEPWELNEILLRFLAQHNFMYYEVIQEDTQA